MKLLILILLFALKANGQADTTVLPEVTVTNINLSNYKVIRMGYWKGSNQGALYMRPNESIALKIANDKHIAGYVGSVTLHFESLIPQASVMIILKDYNWNDLIDGVVVHPIKKDERIDLSGLFVPFPEKGIIVSVTYLGDGKTYPNKISTPYMKYKLTTKHNVSNTFANVNNIRWVHWNNILWGNKNPQNAQIELSVLVK